MGCSCNWKLSCFTFICILLVAAFRNTDGGIIWYEPPPVVTVTDDTVPSVADTTQLFRGVDGSLRWNFTLTGEQFASAILKWKDATVVNIRPSLGLVRVAPSFKHRFNLTWIHPQRATLIIFNVTTEYEGDFSCETGSLLDDGNLKTWIRKVAVDVVAPSKINHTSENQTVNQNERVYLNCTAEGLPTQINISWTRLSDNSVVSMPLTITGRKDQGSYRCTAYNGIGNPDTVDVFITVQNYSPENAVLTSSLNDNTTDVNEVFNITCRTEANPPATFRFYKDGNSFLNITTGSNVAVNTTSISERRSPVSYSCIPFNEYGDGPTATITITVHYGPSASAITTVPSNTTMLRGSTVSLICTTDANPAADMYHFYFNGSYVGNSSSGVLNATVREDGVFTCVPINNIGTGHNATVSVIVVDAPLAKINTRAAIVVEGESITLYCNATGKPKPTVTWTRVGTPGVLSNNATLVIGNLNRTGTPDNMIQYQCTASNGVDSPATDVANITLWYPPSASTMTTVPSNTTVLRGSTVSLICTTDANPAANMYHFYFNGSFIGKRSSGVLNTTVREDGVFTCVPFNEVGTGHNATVIVVVVDAPLVEVNTTAAIVVEGESITLYCNASGKPEPTITWTRVGSPRVLSNDAILVTGNLNRSDNMIQFQCTASNGVENPATAVAKITVHYPPKIIVPSEEKKTAKNGTTIKCVAEGNPTPEYVWKKADGGVAKSGDSFEVMKDGNYTCTASNRLRNISRTIVIVIGDTEHRRQVTLVGIEFLKEYSDLSSEPSRKLITKFLTEMDGEYKNKTVYNRTEVIGLRNGSVIVSFVMYFETPVTASDGLAKLRDAVDNGRLGSLEVKDLKVIQANPTTTPPDSTERSTFAATTLSKKDGPPWSIIGGAIGVAVFIVIIIVVAWCVRKKRKCRRPESKVHNSESQVLHDQNDIEDGAYARVNNGYAVSGPPSASGSQAPEKQQQQMQQQQAAAAPPANVVVDKSKKEIKDKKNGNENIPDYAVVDKSKKKKKGETENSKKGEKSKGSKNADANVPEYAVVDKSIKKKKKEDEHAYASVDMSRKSKKQKLKPGEVLYADLGDFQPVGQMPVVSTSPEPLPPIKRPPSYQETTYADITQFLTGNATLPAGQETEMEPTYANSGGGKGAAANENPKTGQQDTGPKETPM